MKKREGVTLVELLVCMAIMGMLGLGLMGILKGSLDIWGAGKEKADVIAQARVALDRLTRELREATYMCSADEDGINFSAYLQEEGPTPSLKDISYYYISEESTLYRNEDGKGGKAIAYSVDDFEFLYYTKGPPLTEFPPGAGTYKNIWMITVKSTVKSTKKGRWKESEVAKVELRSTAQPRNYDTYHKE